MGSMDSRAMKKFIYGLLFIVIILLIWFPFWLMNRPAPTCSDEKLNQKEEDVDCGGPCVPCAIKHLKPIQVKVEFVPLAGATNAVLQFSNPNIFYGAGTFRYTLAFQGVSGNVLYEETFEGFIYPGEQNHIIIHANLPVDSELIRGAPEIAITNEDWKSLDDFSIPETLLRETRVDVPRGSTSADVSAVIVNNNPFPLSRTDVGVILYDSRGATVGLSKTVVRDIPAFSDRFFKLAIPFEGTDLSPNRTEILVYPLR